MESHSKLTHTFGPNFSVTIRAGALVGARKVMAVLARAAVMQSLGALVHICGKHGSAFAWSPHILLTR